MKQIVFLLPIIFFFGCQKEGDIIFSISTENGIARYEVGHVEITFDFEAMTGQTISVTNGNNRAIGVYITNYEEESIIIFSDSWIGGLDSQSQEAVFDEDEVLRVRVVVYRSFGGAIQTFIQNLTNNFWEDLNDTWIEHEYDELILLTVD